MDILFDKINIALIVVGAFNLILGAIIFINGKRKRSNVIYSAICVALIGWISAMVLYRSSPQETALFYCTLLYIFPTLIPSIFLYFTYIFPFSKDRNIWKTLLIFGVNLAVILMVVWPGLIIKEANVRPGLEKEIIFSSYYWIYFLYISGFFSYAFTRLFKRYRESSGVERSQVLYLLIGDFLAANLAFVTNLIMPWLGFFFLNWLGQIFTIIMVGFATYAIVKYRLMDIRIVARRVFIYFGVAVFTYGTFYLVIWFYNKSFGSVFSASAYAMGLIIAPLFVFLFYSVDKGFKIFANKYLFYGLYNYQETINKLSQELNYSINLNKIISSIVDNIKQTMQLDRAGVLLINTEVKPTHYQIAKVIGFNKQNGISLVQDNFLTWHLQKTQKPLVRDELTLLSRDSRNKKEQEDFKRLYDHMKHIEAFLCLPLMSGSKLIGIVVLGSKISGDAYTKEDLELLGTLANQAGIAIDNARLYSQVQDLSENLQQKVDEQTKDLLNTNKELKFKNKLNEELLNMKTDFLRVVNHQLNTPLSVMRGAFAILTDKKMGREEFSQAIKYMNGGLKRMSDTINDFWDAFSLEGQEMVMDPDQTNLMEIINEQVEEKKLIPLAKERNIEITIEKPSFEVPPVWCDSKKITHVVSNLLDNAIFYTPKGKVTVSFEQGKGYLKVLITDTGAGISKEDQKRLFKKFTRGESATGLHPDGSGLGLYIAQKIIEGNGGKLKLEKTELNKGSVFSFTLPLYAGQKARKQTELEKKVQAALTGQNKQDIAEVKPTGQTITKQEEVEQIKQDLKQIKQDKQSETTVKPKTKPKVLLIEDERNLVDIYHTYFKKNSYEFYSSHDIEESMKIAKTNKPDIILLDIIIPKKMKDGGIYTMAEQGWDFLKLVKQDKQTKDIPVIVFTNLNTDKDRQKARQLGAVDYIFKGKTDPNDLVKRIDEIINRVKG